MSEPRADSGTGDMASAGAILRAAREKQGLHVAALAAAIKIPQRKLEALESDRFDELPDATFARALAMTVCRALKIDSAPVLARLPQLGAAGLSDVAGGLNTPFRERAGRSDPVDLGLGRQPLVWAALLVLVAAALMFVLPAGWWQSVVPEGPTPAMAPAPEGAASAAAAALEAARVEAEARAAAEAASVARAAADAASASAVEVLRSVPSAEGGASTPVEAAERAVMLRAIAASWVEVIDGDKQVLVQRVLQPGESLGLDGKPPFKLKIGNAAATQLQFRGRAVDLGPVTRDNVARLELK